MEQLLHYVWKHKIFPLSQLRTTSGRPVEVIDPGLPNRNAGPDFFNAKLKIDGMLWVGNVEVHAQASDWLLHRHDRDKAYDTVILHVVGESNGEVCRTNGEPVPQMVLACPETVRRRYEELRRAEVYPPCHSVLASLPNLAVHSWLSALQAERFEQKAHAISRRLERCNHHWEDVFFITLARNFGFGLNGDAFEAWANRLPFRAIDRHRDSLFQVEAFFLGQAGLLEGESVLRTERAFSFSSGQVGLLKEDSALRDERPLSSSSGQVGLLEETSALRDERFLSFSSGQAGLLEEELAFRAEQSFSFSPGRAGLPEEELALRTDRSLSFSSEQVGLSERKPALRNEQPLSFFPEQAGLSEEESAFRNERPLSFSSEQVGLPEEEPALRAERSFSFFSGQAGLPAEEPALGNGRPLSFSPGQVGLPEEVPAFRTEQPLSFSSEQVGLSEEASAEADDYYLKLRKEFRYLQHKFELPAPMPVEQWRFLRLRPDNFPHVRLAQLACLYHKVQALFSRIMEAETLEAVKKILAVGTSVYWEEHFNFRKVSPRREKRVGDGALNLIAINTVIPFLYAYGLHKADDVLCDRATRFLESLKAENNRVTRLWDGAGLPVSTAADSQALLQLQKEYCDKKDCLRCRFGYEYLRHK